MSEETPAVAVQPEPIAEPSAEPATPSASQQPEPPAEPPQEPQEPLTKDELARAVREDGRKAGQELERLLRGEEPIEEPAGEAPAGEEIAEDEINPETGEHIRWQAGDPSGTYRDERGALHYASGPMKGKFASPEIGGVEGPKEAPAVEGRAAEGTPGEAPAAPQLVTIPLPTDHPIRGMGVEQLVAADPQQEQALRALVNGTYYRRQDVEVLERQVEALQLQQFQTEVSREAEAEWMGTPEYQQAVEQYHEILDMQGEQAAQRFWMGAVQQFQNLAAAKYQERVGEYELAKSDAAANVWANQTFRAFSNALPQPVAQLPEFRDWFAEELELFNARIERGHIAPTNAEELNAHMWELMKSRIAREPKAQSVLRAMHMHAQNNAAARAAAEKAENDKKVAAQAVDQFKKGAASTRTRIPPSPLSRAPGTAPVGRSATRPTETDVPPENVSPQQLRRQQRAGAREDARRHLGNFSR